MQFHKHLVLALFAALLLVACKSGPSKLVGKWDVVLPNGQAATEEFKPDGTFVIGTPNKEMPSMVINMNGTYHDEGDQLYMTFKDVQFEGMPAELKGQEEKLKADAGKSLEIGTEKVATIKWSGDSAFETSTSDGNKATFKKKA